MDGAVSDCWQDGSDGEKQVCGNMGAVKVISFKTNLTVKNKNKVSVGRKHSTFPSNLLRGQRIRHHLPRALLLLIHICIGKCEGSKHISQTLKQEQGSQKAPCMCGMNINASFL